jgi:hypothetical protein
MPPGNESSFPFRDFFHRERSLDGMPETGRKGKKGKEVGKEVLGPKRGIQAEKKKKSLSSYPYFPSFPPHPLFPRKTRI